jgi:hypothetical protein
MPIIARDDFLMEQFLWALRLLPGMKPIPAYLYTLGVNQKIIGKLTFGNVYQLYGVDQ